MQLFWIRNAIYLTEEQFDHRVTLALRDVLGDIEKYNTEKPDSSKSYCYFSCSRDKSKREFIQTNVLDSLLRVHFSYQKLDTIYEFAIVKSKNDSLLFARKGSIHNKISVSCHKAGLSCIKNAGSYYLEVYFPKKRHFIIVQMAAWLILSIIFLLIVIFSFAYIVMTIVRQKKISEMKNDFINNMTHELKTPISTISMASEVLLKSDNSTSSERLEKYAKIIYDENQRLYILVDQVLRISELDKQAYNLQKTNTDIHEIIQNTVSSLCLEQRQKQVKLSYSLNAEKHFAVIDRMHFSNIIRNLIDNAYKYCDKDPEIFISTYNTEKNIHISIKDNGIGIRTEKQKHIFEKFYRVHTGDIHDVKGFGLGLYYVKTLIELHGGAVTVKSEINKGSEFTLTIPLS